jgi:hypothetical protein
MIDRQRRLAHLSRLKRRHAACLVALIALQLIALAVPVHPIGAGRAPLALTLAAAFVAVWTARGTEKLASRAIGLARDRYARSQDTRALLEDHANALGWVYTGLGTMMVLGVASSIYGIGKASSWPFIVIAVLVWALALPSEAKLRLLLTRAERAADRGSAASLDEESPA